MHTTLFYLTSALAAATASPLHPELVTGRGLFDSLNNAVDKVSNVIDEASNAVQYGVTQARDAVADANTAINTTLDALGQIPSDVTVRGPIANTALWQEAVAFDAEKKAGTMNQWFYQMVAFLQKAESSSHGAGAPHVSKALQFAGLYPTQFNQPQAADPASSLGKYPYYKQTLYPLTGSQCNCHQIRNRQFSLSVLLGRGGPIS